MVSEQIQDIKSPRFGFYGNNLDLFACLRKIRNTLFLKFTFILAACCAAQSDPLPFVDGRYSTEPEACEFQNDADLVEHYGDLFGGIVRNIEGNQLDNNYEMFCTSLLGTG